MTELSVVMQTKLLREHAEEKLIRAINSVLGQKQQCTYELIVVCDGCQKSFDAVSEYFKEEFNSANPRLRLFILEQKDSQRNNHWRSVARNIGIEKAKGRWIIYLDNDDYYTNNYLKQLCGILDPVNDWYTVDDLIYKNGWQQRRFNLSIGNCGTSNIIHKRSMLSRWPGVGSYGREDWKFITNLHNESKKFVSLSIAGYCVAHLPGKNGYDI